MSFHLPERHRDTTHPQLGTTAADGNNGVFRLESVERGWTLALIGSDGSEMPDEADWQWEHVSVHAYKASGHMRTPTWKEMCQVKRECWDAEDVVVQYHPAESEYVNNHPYVLHLWRPKRAVIPTPPSILVGVRA